MVSAMTDPDDHPMSKSHQQFIAVSVTAARLYAEKTGSSRRCDASAANIAFPPMIQSIDYSDPLTRLATITKPTVHPPRRPRDFRRAAYRTAEPVGRSGSRRWKTRRGTRTTPRYSPISTPNSTAWRSALQRAFSGNPSYGFFRGNLQNVRSLPMTRFAADSPLEGDGFEPSVPVAREPVYIAEANWGD